MVCLSSAVTETGRKKFVARHGGHSRLVVLAALALIVSLGVFAMGMMNGAQHTSRDVVQGSSVSTSVREAGLGVSDFQLSGQLMAQAGGDVAAVNDAPIVELDGSADREPWLLLLPLAVVLAVFGAMALAYVQFRRTRQQIAQLSRVRDELVANTQTLERRVDELITELDRARNTAEQEQRRAKVVLQDANHRIGNSLATVSSLLSLQMLRSPSPVVRDALESAQGRVHAIAASHRCLKLGDEFETVGADEFLDAVLEDLASSLGRADRITLAGQIDSIIISARDATTLGILLGELVTNAIKHAFRKTDGGTITVTLKAVDGVPTLSVGDDGNGLAPGEVGGEGGLGAVVVKQLAGQFGGAPRYEQPAEGGLLVIVPLPGLIGNLPKSSQ